MPRRKGSTNKVKAPTATATTTPKRRGRKPKKPSVELRTGIRVYLIDQSAVRIYRAKTELQPKDFYIDSTDYAINADGSVTVKYNSRGKEHKDTFPAGSYIASEWEETLEGAQSRIARTEKFLGKTDEDGHEEVAEIEVPEVKVTARRKKRKKVMKKAS